MMKVDLTKEDCNNVKAALIFLIKSANTSENSMAVLLMLARKFNWVEPVLKEDKKGDKNGS